MSIRIDAQELHDLLRLSPPEQNIMLIGKHGIGKSEMISAYYRQQNMRVVPFFLGQMSDPGDLIGLMNKDEATGRSVFLPPYWWPSANEPIVLFLDELNRARPEILQAVQDLSLNKTLAGKTLPAGSIVIAAVNEGDEYQLTELDPALVSRFNLYEFSPTVEDWLLWANSASIDERVINFIQKHHEHLDSPDRSADESWSTAGLVKTPDRRAWVKVARFIEHHRALEEIHLKIIAGIVGPAAAAAFKQSLHTSAKVTPEQILLRFDQHQDKLKTLSLAEFTLLNEQIAFWLNSKKYKPEQADLIRKNLLAYLKFLQKAKQNEAIAHLAGMIQSPKFSEAMGFIAASMELITFMTDYIQGIQV
jgi:MoxR-like ATPase